MVSLIGYRICYLAVLLLLKPNIFKIIRTGDVRSNLIRIHSND